MFKKKPKISGVKVITCLCGSVGKDFVCHACGHESSPD